jgi:hypothetical protein
MPVMKAAVAAAGAADTHSTIDKEMHRHDQTLAWPLSVRLRSLLAAGRCRWSVSREGP